MTSRRRLLTLLGTGTAALAGCGGNTSSSSTSSKPDPAAGVDEGTPGEEEEELTREDYIEAGIPLDGLGAYEEKLLEADPLEEGDRTIAEINRLLEQNDTVEQEADALTQLLNTENYDEIMAEYHHQKAKKQEQQTGQPKVENTAVININYGFTANSGETIEIYNVQNGQLQSQPIIQKNSGQRYINKPGQDKPEFLADLRDSDMWTRRVTQDYQSVQEGIERGIEVNNATEEDVRQYRADELTEWSRVMFGIDDEPRVRPLDVDTADTVFEAMYGDGDAQILAELSNQYAEKDYSPETLVEVEYTGNDWNFITPEDREEEREMGDPLKGEKQYNFS